MDALDRYFRSHLRDLSASQLARASEDADKSETAREFWWRVFEAQAASRQLDMIARDLQRKGEGFYTIGSAGHESNALVALALRSTDPALLHYRSGAFYVARAQQVTGTTPVRDVLQGLMALAAEPISGGRHKVFGHPDLAIIPQTSTIASHLPRSVGLAVALQRAQRLGVPSGWPADAVVVCSFGDASGNHSTATGAINTALNAAYRGLPVPLLLVCEDNGWGVSVPTSPGWVEAAYGSRHRAALRRGRRFRTGGRLATDRRGGRRRTRLPPAHLRSPAYGPLRRSRRQRCRDQLPAPARHRGRLRQGSFAGHGRSAGCGRGAPRRDRAAVRSHSGRDRRRGRVAQGHRPAQFCGRGDGAAGAAESGSSR